MTKVILVRHGETDDNQRMIFQGQGGHGMNARGRAQAAKLAARLAGATNQPAAIYSSDLARARETADVLGETLGLTPRLDPELREVFLGTWQGLSHAEVKERFPEEWEAWQTGVDMKRGGGENYVELGERMMRAVERIATTHEGKTTLAVSHGTAITTFAASVLGVGMRVLRALRVSANTGVTVVERVTDGRFRMLVWNDVAHLHDAVLEAIDGRALFPSRRGPL